MFEEKSDNLRALTAHIVEAYVEKNPLPAADLPSLIERVSTTFMNLGEPRIETKKPAVPAKRSIKNDYIVCLEDGKKFKSVRRHLMAEHGMTPDEYREKWNLPANYPMVAPSYSAARSQLAKSMGLGRMTIAKRRARKKKP